MKKSGTFSWFKKSIKSLLPAKGDSTLGVILKLVAILFFFSISVLLLPIVITIIVFFVVKSIEYKNPKFKTYSLIAVVIFGLVFTIFYWNSTFVDIEDQKATTDSSFNESNQEENNKNDISDLLNETKKKIKDFNENLEIASNYKIDSSEYENVEELKVDNNSTYEEMQEVLGVVTTYNEYLANLIDEAKNETFKVVKVVDGDTIKIEYNGSVESIRLIGIDTPETVDPNEPVGCFGEEASNKMKELVDGKSVKIMFDNSQGAQDRYGRLLLYIWVGDTFVNKKMIEDGYAYEYTYSTPYIYQKDFKAAQESAKSLEKGLWGDVCACEKKELSRTCSSCKIATVKYQNWDCSTYTKSISDSTCTSGCTTSTPTPSPTYVCDCSKTCSEISSCAEAYYQLNTCGCSIRDRDNDGIPCESLCN